MKYKKSTMIIFIFMFLLLLPIYSLAEENILSYYADSDESELNFPYGLALDEEKNLLIADSKNHLIRKVEGGQTYIYAGKIVDRDLLGMPLGGYKDGDLLSARFNNPRDIAVDSEGSIYVADARNHVIRKIVDNKVTTFAGSGQAGYADGFANEVQFNLPSGLAVSQEDYIFVADTLNNVIRKISPEGEVTTVADASFNEPCDIAVDKDGILYVADSGNQKIKKIINNEIVTFAGCENELITGTNYVKGGFREGTAEEAKFNFPKGIEVTEDGTIIIADTWNHRIRAITTDGEVKNLIGNGTPGDSDGNIKYANLNGPVDVLYNEGNLFISDMWNNCIKFAEINLQDILNEKGSSMQNEIYETDEDNIKVYVNDNKVYFDTKPFIENGKTMVPLRKICEKWGADVSWIEKTKEIKIIKGVWKKNISFNNDPLKILNGRTVVHIRFLAEEMGFNVEWLPQYKVVEVSS